eukprot:scaffold1484_cov241-Pinguiococcus_pyrenoidosus.AAC.35
MLLEPFLSAWALGRLVTPTTMWNPNHDVEPPPRCGTPTTMRERRRGVTPPTGRDFGARDGPPRAAEIRRTGEPDDPRRRVRKACAAQNLFAFAGADAAEFVFKCVGSTEADEYQNAREFLDQASGLRHPCCSARLATRQEARSGCQRSIRDASSLARRAPPHPPQPSRQLRRQHFVDDLLKCLGRPPFVSQRYAHEQLPIKGCLLADRAGQTKVKAAAVRFLLPSLREKKLGPRSHLISSASCRA